MKESLIYSAENLFKQGLLLRSDEIALREGEYIITLYASADLNNLSRKDIQRTRLSDIGPSDSHWDIFRQAFATGRRVGAVLLSHGADTFTLSQRFGRYPALLDDSAQILGPVLRTALPGRIKASLGGAGALLVKDHGGLCVAENLYDLEGTAQILEKTCRVIIDSWYLGEPCKIPWLKRVIMRWKYLHHYQGLARIDGQDL